MVIVTKNQYLLASKIHHITMEERIDYNEVNLGKNNVRTAVDKYHMITIIYSPDSNTGSGSNHTRSSEEVRECAVIVRGAVNAVKVFHDLVRQIREQMPDQLFLDTALERMIADTDFDVIDKEDNHKMRDDFESVVISLSKSFKKPKIGKSKKIKRTKPLKKRR